MARILVVEDNPDQRELRRMLFERAGHEVEVAATVVEAGRAGSRYALDLVVMDLHLPGAKDGVKLIRRLRELSPAPRIVVLSGFTAELKALPEAKLVDAVVSKPCRSAQLLDIVSRLLVIELRIKVIPKSSRNEIVGTMADGALKVKITAAPEKGKANAELCAFLAKHYGVSKSAVAILSGETSPLKLVRIAR